MTASQTHTTASLTDTAGAEQYVPREATERVLAGIEAALDAGDRFILLSGPPGLGKTLLLHVLHERQRGKRRVIYSPFLHFPPDEARVWLRALLRDETSAAEERRRQQRLFPEAASERPLLLLLDEAQSMPPETAAYLIEMLPELAPGASILLAGIEGPRLDDVVESFGLPVERLHLESRLSPAETRELLDRAMPPEAAASIEASDGLDVEAYYAAAEGNPRVLKALMFQAERGEPPPLLLFESSEVREGLDVAGEDPPGRDDGEMIELPRSETARSYDAPLGSELELEPNQQVIHDSGAHPDAMGVPSEEASTYAVPESGADQTPRQKSSPPQLSEQAEQAVGYESRRAAVGRRSVEMILAATALGVGFVVARLVVPSDFLRASIRTGDAVSEPLPDVSAPPPEQIAPIEAEPIASRPSAAATAWLYPGLVEEAPAAAPTRVERAPTAAVNPSPVTLHVNARPWATIRLDGETIGVTPLSRPGTQPGRYVLEAELPDGSVLRRVVEVGPDSRFVSFP